MTNANNGQIEHCEWNPVLDEDALLPPHTRDTDCQRPTEFLVGNYHLCGRCALLPRFRRFKKKPLLRGSLPTPHEPKTFEQQLDNLVEYGTNSFISPGPREADGHYPDVILADDIRAILNKQRLGVEKLTMPYLTPRSKTR